MVVVKRRDLLGELEVFGSEQESAGDRDSVVDNDAVVVCHIDPGLFDAARFQVQQYEPPLHAHHNDAIP